ncbi:MAG: bifunctional DNA primase/polymerase [Elusimicrobia bacterium]|nr:bifunctional DNA primase/polymerase [Elusimicrobiota bacterium]
MTENKGLLAALRYDLLGWGVIPVLPGGKRPLIPSWKEFQTRRATAEEIHCWWETWPDANVAVVTGGVSGLVVLDVDGPVGRASIVGKELPITVSVKTGKGFHYYYRHPGGVVGSPPGILPGLDIRGDGAYVVAPPSIHENGTIYEWPFPLSPEDTPLADMPNWLRDMVVPTAMPVMSNGLAPHPALLPLRATEYVDLLNGVEQGRRNATAARLAGRLLAKGHARAEVIALLSVWNEKNDPPLAHDELVRVVNSIAHREAVNHPPAVTPAPKIFTKPIGELLNGPEPETDWLVKDLLEKGMIGFIAGEPKLSKSWLGLDLLVALASGTPFMGHFEVAQKRKVLYIQEEDGAAMVRKRIKHLMAGRGVAEIDDVLCRCSIRVGFKIDVPEWQAALHHELATFGPDIVIMDVFNKLHTKEENSQQQMTEVMNAVEGFRRACRCSVLIVHHFRKSGGEGKSSRANQRMRGSSVLSGWSENSLYLTGKAGKHIKVEHESKNAPQDPFLYLLEDVTDGEDKVGVRVVFAGDAGEFSQAERLSKILRAVEDAAQGGDLERHTTKGLKEATGLSENTIRAYAKLLEDGKKIRSEKRKMGDRGNLVTCYFPATTSSDQGV